MTSTQLAALDAEIPTAIAWKRHLAGNRLEFCKSADVYNHYYALWGSSRLAQKAVYAWREERQMAGESTE